MGQFSSAFKTEALKAATGIDPEFYAVLKLTLPSGVYYISSHGVQSAARGDCDGRIESWGKIPYGISLRDTSLRSVTTSVRFLDTSRLISTNHERYGDLVGSGAEIWALSPNVADASAWPMFKGVLDDYSSTNFVWDLKFRVDDAPLRKGTCTKVPLIGPDWPVIPQANLNLYSPVLYGVHSSQGITNRGMVRGILVSKTAFGYMFSLGYLEEITNVYVNGALVAPSSYGVFHNRWSGVAFNDPVPEDAVVTADVRGITANADGTGGAITNFADQLRHWLVTFVWGDWSGIGAYPLDSTAPISTAKFDALADYCDVYGHEGAFKFGGSLEPQSSDTVLQDALKSFKFKPYWLESGLLAVGVVDPRAPTSGGSGSVYVTDPYLEADEDAYSELSLNVDRSGMRRGSVIEYGFDDSDQKYTQKLIVSDLGVRDNVYINEQMPWGARRVI